MRIHSVIMSELLIMCVILWAFDVSPANATSTILYIDPSTTYVMPGTTFTVDIDVSDVVMLYSWQANITFNPSVLTCVNVTEGDFLAQQPEGTFGPPPMIEEGTALFGWVTIGAHVGVSGSGTLAHVEFEALAEGESLIEFADIGHVTLLEAQTSLNPPPNFELIEFTPQNGLVISSAAAVVAIDPPTTAADLNASFSINIAILNVFDLYAYEFRVGFDKNVLTSIYALEGSFLMNNLGAPHGTHFSYQLFDDYVYVACVTIGSGEDVYGASGSGTLAILEFAVEAPGASNLDIYDSLLLDYYGGGAPIPHTAYDGYFETESAPSDVHDVAVTDVYVSPTSVEAGQYVAVNVTVENQGIYEETFDVTVYFNLIPIGPSQTIVSMANGTTLNLAFNWDTTGVPAGTYTISAEASLAADTDQDDNFFVDGSVSISAGPPSGLYTRLYLPHEWVEDGVAMGWHTDDGSWPYTLPFNFPFYGTYYRTIYISSNGLITFTGPDSSFGNSVDWLTNKLAIAVAWDDLATYAPRDIFIWQSDSTHVVIRWNASPLYNTAFTVDFEAILGADGVIQLNYGYNDCSISATVGISNGAGDTIAEDITNCNYINSILFTPYRPEHDLSVHLQAPSYLLPDQSTILNATVENLGSNDEFDLELELRINDEVVSSAVIPELVSGSSYTMSHEWTPAAEGLYNVSAFTPPVLGEMVTANNEQTVVVSVARPLIQPVEGQWANYTIMSPYGTQLLNTTYSHYISPTQMQVYLWISDMYNNTMSDWLTLNIVTRQVEAGIWSGLWYPLWIQTDVALGSPIGILDRSGTIAESRHVEVGDYLVECWGLQVLQYDMLYTFWFDKVNGLVVALDGASPYNYTQTWRLISTNVPLVYLPRLRIQLTPENGPVGTEVTVTGANAAPESTLEIYWDDTYVGTTVADENGNFAYSLTVPTCTRGVHTIEAIDLSTGIGDTYAFTVLPKISVAPVSGPMGTKVQVSGLGFGAHERVVLTFEDMQIAEINTDGSGCFTATFNIPLALNGQYRVKAWYGLDYAEAAFTVTEVSELDVTIDVGAIYFKGETAEFYVQTVFNGKPIDVTTLNAQLYMPDGATKTLAYSRIATGLYKILFTISGKGSMTGTYTVVVEATQTSSSLDAYGTSIRTFIVKPTWERELPKMTALSIASIALIGSMLVLWKREKKRYL